MKTLLSLALVLGAFAVQSPIPAAPTSCSIAAETIRIYQTNGYFYTWHNVSTWTENDNGSLTWTVVPPGGGPSETHTLLALEWDRVEVQ